MPWKASSVMEERLRFVARLLDAEAMTDICRDFGVSRTTGYKIFDRYKEYGLEALTDRSRRPVRYANRAKPSLQFRAQKIRPQQSTPLPCQRRRPRLPDRPLRSIALHLIAGWARLLQASTVVQIDSSNVLITFLTSQGRKCGECARTVVLLDQGVSIAGVVIGPTTPANANPPQTEAHEQPQPKIEKSPSGSGEIFHYSSGWLGGGHNQTEACAQGAATLTAQNPGKTFRLISSGEDVKKEFPGRVS
jgi:hypothetical protein